MRQPYKVIVWAPSAVGTAALRELVKRPEFEIVGVMAYSPSKIGKDVGELIDHSPIGVIVTGDKEAIFAMEADCVLYAGAVPIHNESMEDDLLRILESGKNVVTSASHHYPPFRGQAYMDKLEAACRKGGTAIHGTGENPGFWFERVALTLTGVCTEVEHIQLDEFVDLSASNVTAETLYALGYNQTVEAASTPGPLDKLWENYYYVETLTMASQALYNRRPDRIEKTSEYPVADKDIELSTAKGDLMNLQIEKGKVSILTHRLTAYIDEKPRLSIMVSWYVKRENAPYMVKDDHYWRIRIEGKPVSLDCEFSAFASLKGNQLTHPNDPTAMTWYMTAVMLIQAIPIVCSREPGNVVPSIFTHAVPDFRMLEDRTSVVG